MHKQNVELVQPLHVEDSCLSDYAPSTTCTSPHTTTGRPKPAIRAGIRKYEAFVKKVKARE